MIQDDIFDPFCDYNNPKIVKYEQIHEAAERIKSHLSPTPCNKSHLSKSYSMNIWLKKEFMHYTGSFKERGACNALLCLPDETKQKGVCVASSGNYGQGIAYVGNKLNIPTNVFMPESAPLMKITNCIKYGAKVHVKGKNFGESKFLAQSYTRDIGAIYLNGFDHPDVIAGQGTTAIEILQQVPDVDVVVSPIGGGSLVTGVAVAVKKLKPNCKIVGVETTQTASFHNALRNGKPMYTELGKTLADGLSVPKVGANTFATAQHLIDKMVIVNEDDVALAILRLAELEKAVVEGAGAAPVAAILSGQLSEFRNQTVVLILSGGNIDTKILAKCFTRGLVADKRLFRFTVTLDDAPGSASDLCRSLADVGVQIQEVKLDRVFQRADVFRLDVYMVCETRDEEHFNIARSKLKSKFNAVNFFQDNIDSCPPSKLNIRSCESCKKIDINAGCPGCQ